MRIAYNPLYNNGQSVGALTAAPANSDITFDLPGRAIYAKGVKFKGSDHTYNFKNDTNVTLTTTAQPDDATDVNIGVNILNLRKALLEKWDIDIDKASYSLTTQWTDSGVDLSTLESGVYVLHINYEGVHYSGTFSLCTGTINTDDEILLHSCGNTTLGRGRVFAKICAGSNNKACLKLALEKAETNISKFSIKIKQIG